MALKFSNYCRFLHSGDFEVTTTLKEFTSTGRIDYICPEGHIRSNTKAAFGNRMAKVGNDIEAFCPDCQKGGRKERRLEELCTLLEEKGRELVEYDPATRVVRYMCGTCGNLAKTHDSNLKVNFTENCIKCLNNKFRNEYLEIVEKIEAVGLTLALDEEGFKEFYKNNKQKLPVICSCGREANIVLNDIVRGKKCSGCAVARREATVLMKYGERNVMYVREIVSKWGKSCQQKKTIEFKSGKLLHVNGYETYAIYHLLTHGSSAVDGKITPDDIVVGTEVPKFEYKVGRNTYTYYPDIYIKNLDLIVEVKSERSYNIDPKKNAKKFESVANRGYTLEVLFVKEDGKVWDTWIYRPGEDPISVHDEATGIKMAYPGQLHILRDYPLYAIRHLFGVPKEEAYMPPKRKYAPEPDFSYF